jgi:transposase
MFLNKIFEAIKEYTQNSMSNFIPLNQHQKKALVIQLYEQGKTRRQISEVVHMSFKDIADVIKKHTGEDSNSVNKQEKSKAARAFELFLQGKQSVEVAIELDMSADEVEELQVQYWRLSKLDDLEELYHETKYSLSLLLQLFKILKIERITKDKDIYDLIELVRYGLPSLRNRQEDFLNQVRTLQGERQALGIEILRLRNSIYTNNEIINRQNEQSEKLDRKLNRLQIMLRNVCKDSNYHKLREIIDQRLNDKKPLLVAALVAVMETL